jgi:hypothetical protein
LHLALLAAALVVLARSWVFVAYEQAFFTSDQAIVGLMAKHIAEGRALPLFYYGQPYMLAVEAYVAAPFLALAGPTVAALHFSIVVWNIAVVMLIVTALARWGGVRPWLGLVAVLPLAWAPPETAALLGEAQGGNIEPFFYVVALWFLRARPLALGAVLGLGFLNREFTIFAVPALVAADIWERRSVGSGFWKHWLLALVAFAAVMDLAYAAQPFADFKGPGTRGEMLRGYPASQLAALTERTGASVAEFPARIAAMTTHFLPLLTGGVRYEDSAAQGRDAWRWPIVITLAVMLARAAWLAWRRPRADSPPRFAWYMVGVGLTMALAFSLVRTPTEGTLRYVLMLLCIPVGVIAAWMVTEPSRAARAAGLALMTIWAAGSAADHATLARRYLDGQPNPARALVTALEDRGITAARAPYWTAYKVTFLSGERIKVASTDVARIDEYQSLPGIADAPLIALRPCADGEQVGVYYICK